MSKRFLPKKRNPLLSPSETPDHAILIAQRKLGQTNLTVKPAQVGTSNATKLENLGQFDYAHLRAPLPANLKSSEIFTQPGQPLPEAYFLMRRSSDGYISATGMFKVSFPWAKHAEENAERNFIKSLPVTSHDEVAGNVWVPETFALELAEDYGIVPWIRALLDDAPVASEDPKKIISTPPKFVYTATDKVAMDRASLPPPNTPRGRGRPRASSPAKGMISTGKVASPRKRISKAQKEANANNAKEASASLQAALDSAASVAETESVADGEDKVIVEVDQSVEVNGETEITHTNVKVSVPPGSLDLPMPESTEEMIAKAKEMVEEARKLEGIEGAETLRASKRKADVLDDEEDEEAEVDGEEERPAKKAKVLEQELKKQRVRTRALIGIAATLAIGAFIPYMM